MLEGIEGLNIYYQDEFITLINGDVRDILPLLPEGIVQTCVTSPPYYGLRDYQTGEWHGGSDDCDHIADATKTKKFGNPVFNENRPSRELTKTKGYYFDNICGRCGATRIDKQIGSEPTPQEFVATMVEVFDQVRRVLRKDGTLFLNLGDSYASNWPCSRRSQIGNGSLENGKRENRPARLGGDPEYVMRDDLSPEEVAYVLTELAKVADISAITVSGD